MCVVFMAARYIASLKSRLENIQNESISESTCNLCSVILQRTNLHFSKLSGWQTRTLRYGRTDLLREYCGKQTNKPLTPPLFLMSFKGGWTKQTAALSLSLYFILSLGANPLNAERAREWERLMREFKGGRGQERDVEEREQLVLRADTGHVGKGSAAAYGAVKRPFSLSLFISLPGLSSPCRYGDRDLLPSYGQPAGLRLFWDQHQVFAEILGQQWVQTQHTHAMFCIHVRCSCICVLTLL